MNSVSCHINVTYSTVGFRVPSFHDPPSVSLAADCEDKPQGPPVNGRKGKSSEQCDSVTFLCGFSWSTQVLRFSYSLVAVILDTSLL